MELRDWMHFNRVTCVQVAEAIELSPVYIRMIKAGRYIPSKKVARKIESYTQGLVTVKDIRGTDG